MKVGITCSRNPYTGIGKYAFNLCRGLLRGGIEANILFFDREGSLEEEQRNWMNRQQWIRKIDLRLMGFIPNRRLRSKLFYPFFYNYYLKKTPNDYDIYHAPHQLYAKLSKYRKPCVITYMDREPLLFPQTFSSRYIVMWKKQFSYFKEADMVVAISEQAKKELLDMDIVPEEKIRVVVQGYDEKIFKPIPREIARKALNFPEDKKIVLCVATENPRKNIPTLLKAMKIVQKEIPNVLLVKIGFRNSCNEALKKDLVIFEPNNVPEEKMPYFYNAADVFVLPTAYDVVPYPVQEAIGCGTPVITTTETGMNGKGYVTTPVYNEKKLAEAICYLLNDDKKRKILSAEGLREAKNWTLSRGTEQLKRVYEEVLSAKNEQI